MLYHSGDFIEFYGQIRPNNFFAVISKEQDLTIKMEVILMGDF